MSFDVVIVGGGIAGMCAALRAAQNGMRAAVFLGDRKTAKGSRALYVANIDNMMGLHPTLMQKKYLDLLADQPEAKKKIEQAHFHLETQYLIEHTIDRLRSEYPDSVQLFEKAAHQAKHLQGGGFEVEGVQAPHVVLATGVADRQPIIHKEKGGKHLDGIQWVYPYANNETFLYCIRCEGHLTRHANCGVIGHTDDSAQIALMLHERYGIPVLLFTHGEPSQASEETRKLLKAYKIEVHPEKIVDIQGEKAGHVLHALGLEGGKTVPVSFCFVAMGFYRVYNDLAVQLGMGLETEGPPETRHVLVDKIGESSLPNAFAIGDMARRRDEPMMKQIYTSQEYAVRAVDAIDRRIRRQKRQAILSSFT